MLLNVFQGVPQPEVSRTEFESGIGLLDFLATQTGIFKSNGEARRMLKDRAVMINKNKVDENYTLGNNDLLNNRYLLVQKGKKNYFLVKIV